MKESSKTEFEKSDKIFTQLGCLRIVIWLQCYIIWLKNQDAMTSQKQLSWIYHMISMEMNVYYCRKYFTLPYSYVSYLFNFNTQALRKIAILHVKEIVENSSADAKEYFIETLVMLVRTPFWYLCKLQLCDNMCEIGNLALKVLQDIIDEPECLHYMAKHLGIILHFDTGLESLIIRYEITYYWYCNN